MGELLRALNEFRAAAQKLGDYGYIGIVGEGLDSRQFGAQDLIYLIKKHNLKSPIIEERVCADGYPHRLSVNVGAYTLYCLLEPEDYATLIADLGEELQV